MCGSPTALSSSKISIDLKKAAFLALYLQSPPRCYTMCIFWRNWRNDFGELTPGTFKLSGFGKCMVAHHVRNGQDGDAGCCWLLFKQCVGYS